MLSTGSIPVGKIAKKQSVGILSAELTKRTPSDCFFLGDFAHWAVLIIKSVNPQNHSNAMVSKTIHNH